MHITYHGLSCFKIIAKTNGRGSDDITILFAPFDKKYGLRPPQGAADVVIVPHPDSLFSNVSIVRGTPIIIDRPGEYTVKGVNIIGIDAPADPRDGQDRGNTVIFAIDVENIRIAYLGALGMDLAPDTLDTVVGADILFVPIGDSEGIDGKTAEILARKIEPKIILPMQYKIAGLKNTTLRDKTDFCSQIGNCPKQTTEKLSLKKKDIENKSMEIILLKTI